MKIIVHSKDVKAKNLAYEKAIEGCDKCPECGVKLKLLYIPTCHYKTKGLFKTVVYQINHYKCKECGCEWESEPFEC